MTARRFVVATSLYLLLTAFLTWPQMFRVGEAVGHHDVLFSIWRITWIAHALRTDPRHLFDANIFFPEQRTLAYSDATLLQGAIAAPLVWSGFSPVAVYNVLLLAGFVGSALAMFVLARSLTGSSTAAFVAGAVFAAVPYRSDHIIHLELQWAMWIPLTFWAIHRTFDDRSRRFGALAGVLVWFQVLSCVYYGIFLALTASILAASLAAARPAAARAGIAALLVGAALAGALTYPYARPYRHNMSTVGDRAVAEIERYSATPSNYLAATPGNRLWGWTSARWGSPERILFPGLTATLLALTALAWRRRDIIIVYFVLLALAILFSFGVHAWPYRLLLDYVPALHGLRVPARFAIVADCAIALLAAGGVSALEDRWRLGSSRRVVMAAVAAIAIAIEGSGSPLPLESISTDRAPVYRVMQNLGRGVVVELPLPRFDRLPGWDPQYAFWSIGTWFPLLNGYSGYYPPSYFATITRMLDFPDDRSLQHLKDRNVRYIVVHGALYEDGERAALLQRIGVRPDLKALGRYPDPVGVADLFELAR